MKLFGAAPEKTVVNERSIRLYLALKAIVTKEGFDFYTIQSFPGLGDDYSATCFAQSMMLEDGWATSTLGDFNTALSVYLLTRLSTEPVYYGDLQHIDKKTGEIKIIGDGAVPPSLAGKLGPAGFADARDPHGGRGGRPVREARVQGGRGRAGPAGQGGRGVPHDGCPVLHLRAARRGRWRAGWRNAASRSGRTAS